MNYRTAVALRRLFIFVSFALVGVGSVQTQNPVVFFAGMPMVLMIYTDTCFNCKSVIFFDHGKSYWRSWLNPLYVPKTCSKCSHEI